MVLAGNFPEEFVRLAHWRRYGPADWYHVPPRTVHAARFAVDSAEIEFWFAPG